MTKKKPDKKFSHLETDHLRATFIDDEETSKNWDSKITKDSIMISLDDGTHPAYEGAEIKLEGFSILKDPAGDHVLYFKHKPEDDNILCHPTEHPDSMDALNKLRAIARAQKLHITMVNSQIKDMRKILIDRYNADLKTSPGVHPNMGYLDKKRKTK
ncbi:MAG: hypothetical protein IBX39_10655 [Candidatus Methanoperedenaceae archaeon]|nr:hypothetical protein [Candidatus Methanoperedenaceae archaeon]